MLKVLELFGGIGACSKALKNIGVDYEIVDYVEIDKYAVKSFNAINNTNFEPQDICDWDKNIDVDLIMHGSPCQDFSLAGKQAGGDENSGTRSSLMYETLRIVENLKPKYVIWENVKNILSVKHKHNFDNYLKQMEELGYKNYYQVLNAKDYGIPQNRERVFTISILGNNNYNFPPKKELKLKLKDMLENEVDEKYYLKDYQIENIKKSNFLTNKRRIQSKDWCDTLCARDYKDPKCIQVAELPYYNYDSDGRVYSPSGISPCLRSKEPNYKVDIEDKFLIKNATKIGYLEAYEGDGVNLSTRMKYQRGNVQKQTIQTITTSGGNDRGVVIKNCNSTEPKLRIRKLTPKECWRLMGFSDDDYDKASVFNSNTQLYKQAGNSIVVDVLEDILTNLLK